MSEQKPVVFDPERRPGVPAGAQMKGRTVFHKLAELWDAANEQGGKEAVSRYESYANWVNDQYEVLSDSLRVAGEALRDAGLTESSEEGRKLFEFTRQEYIEQHKKDPPFEF